MKFGLNLRNFMSDPQRPMHDQIEETANLLSLGEELGFWGAYAPEHWVSHPSKWVSPMPLLGRLAAAGSSIRLITGVLLMPLHNPVAIAEQTIALDQISNGRFILGLGLGYREKELEIVGSNRSERVGRLEESIELMKMLWSGEEVTYRGKYFRATGAQMGIRPVHSPRPPYLAGLPGPPGRGQGRTHRRCLSRRPLRQLGRPPVPRRHLLGRVGKAGRCERWLLCRSPLHQPRLRPGFRNPGSQGNRRKHGLPLRRLGHARANGC